MTATPMPAASPHAYVVELLAGDTVATTPNSPPYTLAAAPSEPVYGHAVEVVGTDGIPRHYHAHAGVWLLDPGPNPPLDARRAARHTALQQLEAA